MKKRPLIIPLALALLVILGGTATLLGPTSCSVYNVQILADRLAAEEMLEHYLEEKYALKPMDYELIALEAVLDDDVVFRNLLPRIYSGHYQAQIRYEGDVYAISIPVSEHASRESFFCDDLQSDEINADVRDFVLNGLDLQGYRELHVEAFSRNYQGLLIRNYYDGQDFNAALSTNGQTYRARIYITVHYIGSSLDFEDQFKNKFNALFPAVDSVWVEIRFVDYEDEAAYNRERDVYNTPYDARGNTMPSEEIMPYLGVRQFYEYA